MNNLNLARGRQTATLNNIIRDNHTPHYHSKEQFLRTKLKDDP